MSEIRKLPTYTFILSGRTARGWRVTDVIEATNGEAAVYAFQDRGFSEVVLHTDDVAAPFLNFKKGLLKPGDMVRVRTKRPIEIAVILSYLLYRKFWYLALPPLGWVVYRLIAGWEWDIWVEVVLTVLLFPVIVGVVFLLASFRLYVRLLRAVGWARWEEVLRLLPRLTDSAMPKYEWPIRRAQALAGVGRLPQALAEFNAVWDFDELPEYLYWVFRSRAYLAARDLEGVLTCMTRAHELAPDLPVVLVDYAILLLTVRHDTRAARPRLAEARRHAVSDTTLPSLLAAEGILAVEEGRPADAIDPLTQSIRQFDPILRGNPSVLVAGARIRAFLALALAATGETAAARRLLQRARPLLVAHRNHELLERCEQAVG